MNRTDTVRVLQVISTIHPTFGGPAIGAAAIARACQELGAESAVLSIGYSDLNGGRLSHEEATELAKDMNSLELVPPAWPSRLQNGKGLLRSIRRQVAASDAVHLHGFYLLVHAYTYFWCRIYGKPYGIQPHGVFEPYQAKRSRFAKAAFNVIVGNALLRRASYVLFASETERERAGRALADKSIVVALAPDFTGTPASTAWKEELIASVGEHHTLLFLGRLARKKRIDLLLQAWLEAGPPKSSTLIIAGPGEDWTRQQIEQRATTLGIGLSVLVLGSVSRMQAQFLYARASAFILPSDNENFAIAVVEAMSCGASPIVTDQVAASDLVLASNGGWVVPPNSTTALAYALTEASADEWQEAHRRGERSRAYVADHLSWRKVAEAIVGAFDPNQNFN